MRHRAHRSRGRWSWDILPGMMRLSHRRGPKSTPVALIELGSNPAPLDPDLNLISAAPDMLRHLETIVAWENEILKGMGKVEQTFFNELLTDIKKTIQSQQP